MSDFVRFADWVVEAVGLEAVEAVIRRLQDGVGAK